MVAVCDKRYSQNLKLILYDWQIFYAFAENMRELVYLLKFTIFDLIVLTVVYSIIMVVLNCFATKILGASWLIDSPNIPTIGLVC